MSILYNVMQSLLLQIFIEKTINKEYIIFN
jgi:hypothetical protein